MKSIIKSIITAAAICSTSMAIAQDVSFAQPYSNPLLLNPALMGANQDIYANTGYTSQWAGIDDGYQTIRVSAMSPIIFNESGKLDAGLYYYNDQAGVFSTNEVGLAVGYSIKVNQNNSISAAIGGAWRNNAIDINAITTGDQYIHGNFDQLNPSGETFADDHSSVIDASFGLFWQGAPITDSLQMFAGFSGYHFYQPQDNFVQNSDAELLARYNFLMGFKYRTIANIDFAPQWISSWQKGNIVNYLGAYLDFNFALGSSAAPKMATDADAKPSAPEHNSCVTLGAWYNTSARTMAFIIGLQYKFIGLGYSYGFANSNVKESAFDMSRNEVSLSCFFNRTGKKSNPLSRW